jgi:hypothetical protein
MQDKLIIYIYACKFGNTLPDPLQITMSRLGVYLKGLSCLQGCKIMEKIQ